ncbi:MAG: hypothetical protein MZU97_14735 [Bacillus subtilis]|nr:hypothetical protein [Bacillus subtilis]
MPSNCRTRSCSPRSASLQPRNPAAPTICPAELPRGEELRSRSPWSAAPTPQAFSIPIPGFGRYPLPRRHAPLRRYKTGRY